MAKIKSFRVIKPNELEIYASKYGTRQWYVGEHLAMGVCIHPPGEGHDRHTHNNAEELVYVISGNLVAQNFSNGKEYPMGPGDVLYVPAGVEHGAYVCGNEPMKNVTIYAPAGAELDVMMRELIIPRGVSPEYNFGFKKGKYKIKK